MPQPPLLKALGVPLPGIGLCPAEEMDPLSPLLGFEGGVMPIALGSLSEIAA